MKQMKLLVATSALLITNAVTVLASPLTDAFSSFWVLGDSLSDNGNLFASTGNPPPPYFDGRFSNGPVWNESIIEEFATENGQTPIVTPLGINNGNLAFGGARADNEPNANGPIPSLFQQVGAFLTSTTPADLGSNPLVSVWAGANDIFQELPNAVLPEEIRAVGRNAADAVLASVGALVGASINNIMVFNLPDIGLTPSFNTDPVQSFAGTEATIAFNMQLAAGLAANPLPNIIEVDAFSIFNTIVDNPGDFGLANVEEECLATVSCILGDQAAQDTFLFWDGVHPTARGHELIEAAARQALAPVPLPATLPMLVSVLVGFGWIARRRRNIA